MICIQMYDGTICTCEYDIIVHTSSSHYPQSVCGTTTGVAEEVARGTRGSLRKLSAAAGTGPIDSHIRLQSIWHNITTTVCVTAHCRVVCTST